MVVGILQIELHVHDAESLKDKRRVVRSLKDRLHREHLVSVAEVARLDSLNVAVLGVAAVGTDGKRIGEVLDAITAKARALTDAEVAATSRQILHGTEHDDGQLDDSGEDMIDKVLEAELLRRAQEGADEAGSPEPRR